MSNRLSQYASWMTAVMTLFFAKTIPSVMLQLGSYYWEKDAWAKLTQYASDLDIGLKENLEGWIEEVKELPEEAGYLPLTDLKRLLSGYYLIAIGEALPDVVNDTYLIARKMSEKLSTYRFATIDILPVYAPRREKVVAIDDWIQACHMGGLEKFDYIFGTAMDPEVSTLPTDIVDVLNALAE